ncbi:MAG: histone deacetylase family protein [Frankiales bacterium]|nr:histone deacetylase family protein [Frankiales bacterium]
MLTRVTPCPVVRSDACLLHVPSAEIWVGVRTPGTEVPERATAIEAALREAGHDMRDAVPHGDDVLLRVHEPRLVEHLRTVHARWMASGIPELVGQDRVVPYVMPTAGMLDGLPEREPAAVHGAAGRYCYDTMTLVGPGTWEAARAAVDVTLTAVDAVVGGEPLAYALVRPPGHHATRAAYGGSCYLNNAAVAADALRGSGHERVAVIDLDAHHGNGTQAVFYERPDVLYASLHVDPAAGWFPHYAGYADETGRGAGAGANLNLPLAEGTGDAPWLDAVEALCDAVARHRSTALVVSLGVDAAADDPESPLRVTAEGYAEAGHRLAALGLPTVAVQEGGYHLATVGPLVRSALAGLASR